MRASPYRSLLVREPEATRAVTKHRPRGRRFGPALAAGGSLVAHAAVLVGSAFAEPAPLAEPVPPKVEMVRGPSLFVMHPTLDTEWSPPPALEACFDARALEATRERYGLAWVEIREFAPIHVKTWNELGLIVGDGRGEVRRFYLQEQAVTCALAAGYEEGRLVVQVGKRLDGSTSVWVSEIAGAEREGDLRCCLMYAAESLVASLRPGEDLRYEHGKGAMLRMTPVR